MMPSGAPVAAQPWPRPDATRRRRARRGRATPEAALLVAWLLGFVVVCSALLIGGLHVQVMLGIGALLALLYGFAVARGIAPKHLSAPTVGLALLAGYCLLQALPLPVGAIAHVASNNIETWRGLWELLGEGLPRALPISLDPGASRLEAVKWGAYALAFALSAGLGARGLPVAGPIIVYVSAVIIALVTLVHRLSGAEAVFGIYSPMGEFARTSIGPLLNPNNLAGYLNLGVFTGLGLMLTRQSPLLRWALPSGVALLIGTVVESRSRGGIVSLVGGLFALGVVAWLLRTDDDDDLVRRRVLPIIGATVLAGVALAGFAISPAAFLHEADSGLRKLAMASWVVPLVRDYPLFGVGRGAFESAFQQYAIGPDNLIYSHPENFVMQWAAEWGIPVTLLGLVGLVGLLRPSSLGAWRNPPAWGALIAVAVLLLQNLVDLGTEVPAIALAAVVAVGSCWGDAHAARSATSGRLRGAAPWALLAGFAVTLLTPMLWPVESVGAARERIDLALHELGPGDSDHVGGMGEELHRAMKAHPADAYFPRLAALLAFRQHDDRALRWIGRALELGPSSGRSHLLLARMLAALKHESQALLELRLAATYDPGLAGHVARIALQSTSRLESLVGVAPPGTAGAQVLTAMATELKDPANKELRTELLAAAITRAPEAAPPRRQLAKLFLASLEKPDLDTVCAGDKQADCARQVEDAASLLERVAPTTSEGIDIRGRLLLATGRPREAVTLLAAKCMQFEERRACLNTRLRAAVQVGDPMLVAPAAQASAGQPCRSVEDCADVLTGVGNVLVAGGRRELALTYFTQAAHEDGAAARWLRVAEIAGAVGQHGLALQALTSVRDRRGRPDPKLQARIDDERSKLILSQ